MMPDSSLASLYLHLVPLCIKSRFRSQGSMRSMLSNRSLIEDRNLVRHPNAAQTVCNQQTCFPVHERLEMTIEFIFCPRIQGRRWLVQNQQIHIPQKCPCQG